MVKTNARTSEFSGRSGEILARLERLHPRLIDLSLQRLEALLSRLGHPERHLPPVIHVAGTNGKGSTVADMRTIAEAAGLRVHAMTSPHLLSLTERFHVAAPVSGLPGGQAGGPVDEDLLVATLEEVEQVNAGAPITVFEVLTAAGFLLFSRLPADLVLLEVGLGGRFDATNVITAPVACVLTSISLDHQAFLGETLSEIAFEKAGIIKPGVPVISAPQSPEAAAVIAARAEALNAPLYRVQEVRGTPPEPLAPEARKIHWRVRDTGNPSTPAEERGQIDYADALGTLRLPQPGLAGPHQRENAVLAVAALRRALAAGAFPAFTPASFPPQAYQTLSRTLWSARLQRLEGRLARLLPEGWELWVDGAHNPGGAEALAEQLRLWRDEGTRPVHLIMGLKNTKDVSGVLRPLLPLADSFQAVAEPQQHLAMPIADILATARALEPALDLPPGRSPPTLSEGPLLQDALERLAASAGANSRGRVVICGSLYLAGCALQQDREQVGPI
ncbi:bifunctional folylpolyglutamate synthase/dihydrofolate synthase [Oecophyllibacter saccharovorans]|uniref:bifunctional folylpolyglutamate synthase/dihydrofolate synthase n=1 Tax=Oecophyllibacter saccharovorans TaxID=2558360 RepID=UPI00114310BB|nr:folylpolyglutamate synthase/dihydrofolate synthase family protein [Oecophyllibacter saccharovorans]QDH14952.1 bifunctional folylpolyglutamate synthase/dihydrofolate synthase [Oecophyllibacter saccharovorans]